MEQRDTEAIVLRIIPFKNSSLIVTLFSKKYGKISILARGARRRKSEFPGYFSPAAYIHIHFSYKETREIQTATAVSYEKPFYEIFSSLEGTAVTYALCELMYKVIGANEPLPEIFDAFVTTLNILDSPFPPAEFIFTWFLVKLSDGLGFQLRLDKCPECGRELNEGVYERSSGMVLCHGCAQARINNLLLTKTMMAFIRENQTGLKEIVHHDLPSTEVKSLRIILVEHLKYHTDQHLYLKSLEILDNIRS